MLAVSIWSSTGSEHAQSLGVNSQASKSHSSEYKKDSRMGGRATGDRICRSDRSDTMDDSVRGSTSADFDRKVNRAISYTLANCKPIATFMWVQQLFSGRILAKDRSDMSVEYICKISETIVVFRFTMLLYMFDRMLSACVTIRS